jgi:hypothetical protein
MRGYRFGTAKHPVSHSVAAFSGCVAWRAVRAGDENRPVGLYFSSISRPLGADEGFVRLDFSSRTPRISRVAVFLGVADDFPFFSPCRLLHVSLSGVAPDGTKVLFLTYTFLDDISRIGQDVRLENVWRFQGVFWGIGNPSSHRVLEIQSVKNNRPRGALSCSQGLQSLEWMLSLRTKAPEGRHRNGRW